MIARVINLARAPERWASIAHLAAERGLAVERIEAVDGRDPAALDASAAAPGTALTAAEIACFESHRLAWGRVVAGAEPFGLVLEDDVFPPTPAVIGAVVAAAGRLDIVKLNAHPRGMLVHSRPVATVDGRALVRPAQRTGDSSAYLISRDFAARALEIHRGYVLPVDVALFDPTSCPDVAQLDPAVTIQQRYADFRFLDDGAGHSDIQAPKLRRPRPAPSRALLREAERVWRRRLVPAMQPLLNLARPEAERIDFRRIAYRA